MRGADEDCAPTWPATPGGCGAPVTRAAPSGAIPSERSLGRDVVSLRHGLAEQGREMRAGFDEMRAGFATVATGMAQITTLLTNITGRDRDDS